MKNGDRECRFDQYMYSIQYLSRSFSGCSHIQELLEQPGITFLGLVSHSQVAESYCKAGYFL
jgi:hypothetical protein